MIKAFDAHSDIWIDVTDRRLRGETDVFHNHHLERLRTGGVEGSVFVIWVAPPADGDFGYYGRRTHEIMRCVSDEIRESRDLRIVRSYEEMIKAREDGIFYVMLGVEGMAYASDDPTLAKLDEYYDFGARHAMLTWNEKNGFGHGAVSGSNEGLSDLGRKAVLRMVDRGMIVDTSHLNEAGFWDIARIMDGRPFIASHSNCRKLCDHLRNLTDDQLRAVRDADGCVGLNVWNSFIDEDPEKRTVERLADHAEHMIDIMGIDHVGCGFDFCEFIVDPDDPEAYTGDDKKTRGLEDASKVQNFFDVLRSRGMSREDMAKIAYGNFHRIIREVVG